MTIGINFGLYGHKPMQDLNGDRNKFSSFPDPQLIILGLLPYSIENAPAYSTYNLLMDSVRYIENKIINHPPCNHCFRTLRHGKTLKEIWDSGKVMLNFIENAEDGLLGLTRGNITSPNGADIGISAEGLKRGKMYVIATIIHELAHVGGAPGNTTPASNEAESVLKCCLLSPYFDPNIFGSINKVSQGSSKKAVA